MVNLQKEGLISVENRVKSLIKKIARDFNEPIEKLSFDIRRDKLVSGNDVRIGVIIDYDGLVYSLLSWNSPHNSYKEKLEQIAKDAGFDREHQTSSSFLIYKWVRE